MLDAAAMVTGEIEHKESVAVEVRCFQSLVTDDGR